MSDLAIRGRTEEVLDAALELFAARGYHATTMNDIGRALGLRGPSLYNHVDSKQAVLVTVITRTTQRLLDGLGRATAGVDDAVEELRLATEAHVRYHARHRFDAYVGNREIHSLEAAAQEHVLDLRRKYAHAFQDIVQRGRDQNLFATPSPRLTAYAIMGMGVAVANWYHPDGPLSEDEVVYNYGQFALRMADVIT